MAQPDVKVVLPYVVGVAGAVALGLGILGRGGRKMRPLTLKESARLAALEPETRKRVLALMRKLSRAGIQTFIGQTLRSVEDQIDAVSQGRSATLRSWHLVGRAVDLKVVDGEGRVRHDIDTKWVRDAYAVMGDLAQRLGFRWLGFGVIQGPRGAFRDPWHLEYRGGLSWIEAARQAGIDLQAVLDAERALLS